MTSLSSDIRHAFRSLAKTPGISLVAIVTLGVGIGLVTAIYSGLRVFVLQPFDYPRSDQIVHIWSNDGQPLSGPDYFDLSDQQTCFSSFGIYSPRPVNLGGEHPQAVRGVSCTPGVLQTFGVQPALGRWFEAKDEEPGAPKVAILSHRLWQQSFGSDARLVGQTIRLNGDNFTVVGIMPASFQFAAPWMRGVSAQVWIPLQLKRGDGDRGSHWACGVARLKDGVTVEAADAQIKAIGAQLSKAHPETNLQKPFLVRTLYFEMTRWEASRVWMLFGAVVLVLLVACANVASMLLARGARRQGELGVRIALGATRGRLLRLMLVESAVLSLSGALAGVALAYAGMPVLRAMAPTSEERRAMMTLDGNALLFAVTVAVVTAILTGLPPALAAVRVSVSDLLRIDSRGATASGARHRLLRGLIITQIAVAFVLANGAALFSASYAKLLSANAELATDRVLSTELNLRGDRYKDNKARARFWYQLAERVAAIPGVDATGLTTKLPLEGGSNMNILVKDQTFDPAAKRTLAEVSAITPGYFATLGIPILRGRTLTEGDAGDDNIGVVVNRALAETCWPGQDPIGQVIRPDTQKVWFHARVVGVVENTRQWGAESQPQPELYWTPDRAWGQTLYLNVRTANPALGLTAGLRKAVAELDPDLPLTRIRTLEGVVEEATLGQRTITRLIDMFMAVALGLLAVGLYGTLSYHVLQRTREIGVRMALGADRTSILRLVFRQGTGWVAVGVLLGIGGALGVATLLKAMIWGISALSPVALLAATSVITVAALLACWIPAFRASRVDPIEALRVE